MLGEKPIRGTADERTQASWVVIVDPGNDVLRIDQPTS